MEETGRKLPDCIDLVQLSMRITPTQGQSLTPFEIMYGRSYSIPDLAKTACHQYEDDETLASYMKRMLEKK